MSMKRFQRTLSSNAVSLILLTVCIGLTGLGSASAADYPPAESGDFEIRDFHFKSGESMPALRIHYRTFGVPRRNTQGVVTNAVLILHGTTGNGTNFLRLEFAGELFCAGQILDASRYYLGLPGGIGHGGSSKPSDGFRAHFP